MAALDFPISPANNQIYTLNGVQYYYNGEIGAWLTSLVTNPINANTTNTQILYNDAGYTNGSIGLVFNRYSNTFSTGNIVTSGNIVASGSIAASGSISTTGDLVVSGTSTTGNSSSSITALTLNFSSSNTTPFQGGLSTLALNNANNSPTSNTGILFRFTESTGTTLRHSGAIMVGKEGTWTSGAGIYPAYLSFWTRGWTTDEVERLRITANGNVGIGNTSPALKLEVAGNMSVDAFVECAANISTSYTITEGRNAMSAGPITLNTGVTVTVPSGSTWTVV